MVGPHPLLIKEGINLVMIAMPRMPFNKGVSKNINLRVNTDVLTTTTPVQMIQYLNEYWNKRKKYII